MAREPTQPDNEFRNRQPGKIWRPAKLTAAYQVTPVIADAVLPQAIISNSALYQRRIYVSLARKENNTVGPRAYLSSMEKNIRSIANFEINPLSCVVAFSFRYILLWCIQSIARQNALCIRIIHINRFQSIITQLLSRGLSWQFFCIICTCRLSRLQSSPNYNRQLD